MPEESSLPGDLTLVVREVREALVWYRETPTEAAAREVFRLRRQSAALAVDIPRSGKTGPAVAAVRELLSLFASWGAGDLVVPAQHLELADGYRQKGWQGLLAAMLVVPAVQWPGAPRLQDVPSWLWPEYVGYLFHVPHVFASVGSADVHARHHLRRLEELVQLGAANRGATAVREALGVYSLTSSAIPLYCSEESLRQQFELRARIQELMTGAEAGVPLEAASRDSRRLKVGFLQRVVDPAFVTVLPLFENLDPERFEVRLYVTHQTGSALEHYAASKAVSLTVLPPRASGQQDALTSAGLDVLVFTDDLSAAASEMSELASRRSAALQLAVARAGVTTALREIDAVVLGADALTPGEEETFAERVAVLPGSGCVVSTDAPRPDGSLPDREALGLAAETIVFGAIAEPIQITAEVRKVWAATVAAVPGAKLVVLPASTDGENQWVWNQVDAQLAAELAREHAPEDSAIILPNVSVDGASAELRRLVDVLLVPFPYSAGTGLVAALTSGVPVVARDGVTVRARLAGAMLREAGLGEWVVPDARAYIDTAVRLATTERAQARARVEDRMARMPRLLDSLGCADAFGALLEKAFDDTYLLGAGALRATSAVLCVEPENDLAGEIQTATAHFARQAESEARRITLRVLGARPALPVARQIMGAIELRAGHLERALKYFVAAIQHDEGNAGLWYDAALALRRAGQPQQALDALRTSLRLDPSQAARQQLLNAWTAETAVTAP